MHGCGWVCVHHMQYVVCGVSYTVYMYSTSRKSLNKRLTSKRVLRLRPPTHWTQFALRASEFVCVRLRESVCVCVHLRTSVCVCKPSTVKYNFRQYLS